MEIIFRPDRRDGLGPRYLGAEVCRGQDGVGRILSIALKLIATNLIIAGVLNLKTWYNCSCSYFALGRKQELTYAGYREASTTKMY